MIKHFSFLSTAVLAMLLLIFVGIADTRHVYTQLIIEREQAEASQTQSLIEDFLDAELKVSFIADILNYLDNNTTSDEKNIAALAGFIADENLIVYSLDGADNTLVQLYPGENSRPPPSFANVCESLGAHPDQDTWWVITPLQRRDTLVGCLAQAIPPDVIEDGLNNLPQRLLITVSVLTLLLAIALGILQLRRNRSSKPFELLSAFAFLFLAAFIITHSVAIYKQGVFAKANQYTSSLAHQLSMIPDIEHIGTNAQDDIATLLEQFYNHATDMAQFELSLPNNKTIAYPPNADTHDNANYLENTVDTLGHVNIRVYPLASVVRDKIANNVLNFAALFVSCCFIAFVWFRLFTSVSELQLSTNENKGHTEHSTLWENHNVTLVQCVWFLAVFMEGLNASFMPDYLRSISTQSNLYSLLFAFFFAAFVLFLIPAGRLVTAIGAKRTVLLGCAATATGAAIMATSEQLYAVFTARFISGAGHGLLFIAIQSYVLSTVSSEQRSSGSARIVFAQNSGILSGAAMGALMFIYIDAKGIFMAATAVALVNIALVFLFMAKRTALTPSKTAQENPASLTTTVLNASRDLQFLVSSLFVGTYSKIIYNGAIFFTIPVLLTQLDFNKPQIGQLLMLFAFSVMLSNYFVPRMAKRFSNNALLLIGMLSSAAGCLLLGAYAFLEAALYQHMAVILGIVIVGYANGFIAAPIVTSIMDTRFSKRTGVSSSLSLYRFIERMGHVLGPIIFAWAFAFYDSGMARMQLFQILAGITIVFALAFWFTQSRKAS